MPRTTRWPHEQRGGEDEAQPLERHAEDDERRGGEHDVAMPQRHVRSTRKQAQAHRADHEPDAGEREQGAQHAGKEAGPRRTERTGRHLQRLPHHAAGQDEQHQRDGQLAPAHRYVHMIPRTSLRAAPPRGRAPSLAKAGGPAALVCSPPVRRCAPAPPSGGRALWGGPAALIASRVRGSSSPRPSPRTRCRSACGNRRHCWLRSRCRATACTG